MSLYGTYVEESAPEVEKTLTIEEYSELVNRAMDFLFEADEELISESELSLIEGTMDNAKITNRYLEMKKEYYEKIKNFRKLYKVARRTKSEEDIKKANDALDDIITILENYRDEIKSINAGSASNILIGFILHQLQNMLSLLPAILAAKFIKTIDDKTLISSIVEIGAELSHFITSLNDIGSAYREYQKSGKTDPKQLNMYRNKIISTINGYINEMKQLKTALNSLKKAN